MAISKPSPPRCPFEQIANPEQEALQIATTADLTVKLLDKRYPPPKQILRGVHPKSHGCVSATFTINSDISPDLQVGLFATPGKQFRAIIRFSNAAALVSPDIDKGGEGEEDDKHGSRGMAIKVLDVDGDLLDDDGGAHNQDFLMINQPVFAFANTEDYLRLTKVLDRDNDAAGGFFAPLQLFATPPPEEAQRQAIEAYMQAEAISPEAVGRIAATFKIVGDIQATKVANPLGTQYFSAAPFLFGPDRVMKFSVKPCQVVPPVDVPKEPADDYLRDVLADTMSQQTSLRFDFMVQVRGADADLGVENASSLWEEDKYHFVKVAEINIPVPQLDVNTAAHQAHCESLVFTPWHSLAAHQPIGSINRLRKSVYDASAGHRVTGVPVNGDFPDANPTPIGQPQATATNLLFYDAAAGEAKFSRTDGKGVMTAIGEVQTGMRKTWTHIVPGNFGVGTTTGLFFYSASVGEARFLSTDGTGRMPPIGSVQTGWRKTWTHIVPGNFGVGTTTGLFLYDATVGEGQFFSTDGKGGMNIIGHAQTGWRKTWSHFVPGNFGGGANTSLFFYDATAGEGQFFSTDGKGSINAIGSQLNGLPKTWSHIVPGKFGAGTTTGLFFYDAKAGVGQFFSTDGKGGISIIGHAQTGWRKTWSHFVPGNFGGNTTVSLLFYDATAGQGQFFSTDGNGGINAIGSQLNAMRKTWSRMVPGTFEPG